MHSACLCRHFGKTRQAWPWSLTAAVMTGFSLSLPTTEFRQKHCSPGGSFPRDIYCCLQDGNHLVRAPKGKKKKCCVHTTHPFSNFYKHKFLCLMAKCSLPVMRGPGTMPEKRPPLRGCSKCPKEAGRLVQGLQS